MIIKQAKVPTGLDYYFHGADYDPQRDKPRLSTQFEDILELMIDGKWRTLSEIESAILRTKGVHYGQASISAQLRNMRKEANGGYTVERMYITNGLYTYRVLNPEGQMQMPAPNPT